MPAWVVVMEWASRAVLVGLFGLSIWSISIIIDRWRFFKKHEESDTLEFAGASSQDHLIEKAMGSEPETLRAMATNLVNNLHSKDGIERTISSLVSREKIRLEKGLSVLGTLGATAPFIGLLGTVMGIIVSFGELSMAASDMNGVMFSLAEALILTAVGLLVAIPAVIAFNYFSNKCDRIFEDCHVIGDHRIAELAEARK